MPRTGLIRELAEKYGMSVSEVKSAIMKYAIAKAKEYKARGMDWFSALRKALTETWNKIRTTKTIPGLAVRA